jgi:hypothetical protein
MILPTEKILISPEKKDEASVRIIGRFYRGLSAPPVAEWMVGLSSGGQDRHGSNAVFYGDSAFCFYQGNGDDDAGLHTF